VHEQRARQAAPAVGAVDGQLIDPEGALLHDEHRGAGDVLAVRDHPDVLRREARPSERLRRPVLERPLLGIAPVRERLFDHPVHRAIVPP
jgi:hypothetical protein